MRIGVPREHSANERRVALTPAGVAALMTGSDRGAHEVKVETGAGSAAGFSDADYVEAGASIADRAEVIGDSQVIVQVNGPTPSELERAEWSELGPDHVLVGLHDPLGRPERAEALAGTGATTLSLELIPRTTRAQSMDVLSSMATVAGYEAVLLAASRLPKMVPMLMTAAGTVPPARFVVLGAGVAGLQAIATARRLGAVVQAYDVRPAAIEQIRSVGARAIELDLDNSAAEGSGGYAAEQSDDLVRRQHALLAPHVAEADVVITTAAVPGAASPELVTTEMIEAMAAGSVIVDLAAERGGNTAPTRPDAEIDHGGVLILGPTDLTSRAPATASQMFSTNLVNLLRHLAPEGQPIVDLDDEIVAGTVVGTKGDLVHPAVRERLGLGPTARLQPHPQPPNTEEQPER